MQFSLRALKGKHLTIFSIFLFDYSSFISPQSITWTVVSDALHRLRWQAVADREDPIRYITENKKFSEFVGFLLAK